MVSRRLAVLVLVVGTLGRCGATLAQEAAPAYDRIPIPAALDATGKTTAEKAEVIARLRAIQSLVNNVLTGENGHSLSSEQTPFDRYFNEYLFPQWTWPENIESPTSFNYLPNHRKAFIRDYINKTKIPQVRFHLLALTLARMSDIANNLDFGGKAPKNYHPVARFNAMVVIADLDASTFPTTGTAYTPLPYPQAIPVMLKALEAKEQLDAVRVAALTGLMRHAQANSRQTWQVGPNESRFLAELANRYQTITLPILTSPPPANRTLDGHVWMQRRVLETLGYLGAIGSNPEVAQVVRTILEDSKAPLSLRVTAAESLSFLPYTKDAKLASGVMLKAVTELAAAVCQSESDRQLAERQNFETRALENLAAAQRARMTLGTGGGTLPAIPGTGDSEPGVFYVKGPLPKFPTDDPKLLEAVKRRVTAQLQAINSAIGREGDPNGLYALAKLMGRTAETTFAAEMTRTLDDQLRILDGSTSLNVLQTNLESAAGSFRAKLASIAPAVPVLPAVPGPELPEAKPAGAVTTPAAPEKKKGTAEVPE